MKRLLAAIALAVFGLAPAIGAACEYSDASMASSSPPAQLAVTPPPAASKVPAPTTVAKVLPAKAVKQAPDKAKAPGDKVAAVTTN